MAGFDPSVDPYEDPYYAWARAQQLAELQAQQQPPLVDPLAPPSADAAGRKGGSTSGPGRTQHIGPALSPGGAETPLQVTPLPDPDPMADADPRGDMTADQLAKPGTDTDAISGAAPAADVASMVQLDQAPAEVGVQAPAPTSVGYYDWARQQAAGQPLPSMQDKSLQDSAQAEIDAIGKMTPDEYIRYQGERAGKLRDMQTQRQAEIDAENQRQAQQAYQGQQAAIAKANADTADMMARANELANTKIVPKKAGLADVVGILLGGMFSGGGPNMALAQFNRKVDADMQAQHENIANGFRGLEMKRGVISDELARHGDLYRAQETYRVASYQAAINHLQTELQQYDPAGTTAMTIRNGLDQFHAAQQQAIAAANKQMLEDNLKRAQTAQAMAGAFKTAAETDAIKAKQAGIGAGAAAPVAKILPVEYFKSLGLVAPPTPMSAEAYKEWLTLGKSSAETAKAQQDAASNANATVVSKPHGNFEPITDANGAPVRVAPDVAKELNEQNASAQNVVRDLNDVKRMLEEDPSTIDRKTWAEIQARIGQTLPAIAGYYKSKFSSREEEAIKDITNLDFDSYTRRFKDKGTAVASINGIIDTIKMSVDTTNSATLHTPVRDVLNDVGTAPKPKPTEVDKLMGELSLPAAQSASLPSLPANRDESRPISPDELASGYRKQQEANDSRVGADRSAQFDRLAALAEAGISQEKGRWYLVDANGNELGPDLRADTQEAAASLLSKYRDGARAGLAKLASDAEDGTIRARAGQALLRLHASEAPQ